MRVMSLEETKQVELDILTQIADFCDRYNLKYYLAYGTLIGAVRHNGFIPWDDDIDIHMPREDYEKFIQLFNIENSDTNYYAVSPYDKLSRHTFLKVIDKRTVKIEEGVDYKNGSLGVDVDVFPLDGQAEDYEVFSRNHKKLFKIYKMMGFLISKAEGSTKRRLLIPIMSKLLAKSTMQKKADRLLTKYVYNSSEFVGSISSAANSLKDRYRKTEFEKRILLDFENRKFYAPSGYDSILRTLYGDYMQLPPEEKRNTHHANNCFWKD